MSKKRTYPNLVGKYVVVHKPVDKYNETESLRCYKVLEQVTDNLLVTIITGKEEEEISANRCVTMFAIEDSDHWIYDEFMGAHEKMRELDNTGTWG